MIDIRAHGGIFGGGNSGEFYEFDLLAVKQRGAATDVPNSEKRRVMGLVTRENTYYYFSDDGTYFNIYDKTRESIIKSLTISPVFEHNSPRGSSVRYSIKDGFLYYIASGQIRKVNLNDNTNTLVVQNSIAYMSITLTENYIIATVYGDSGVRPFLIYDYNGVKIAEFGNQHNSRTILDARRTVQLSENLFAGGIEGNSANLDTVVLTVGDFKKFSYLWVKTYQDILNYTGSAELVNVVSWSMDRVGYSNDYLVTITQSSNNVLVFNRLTGELIKRIPLGNISSYYVYFGRYDPVNDILVTPISSGTYQVVFNLMDDVKRVVYLIPLSGIAANIQHPDNFDFNFDENHIISSFYSSNVIQNLKRIEMMSIFKIR